MGKDVEPGQQSKSTDETKVQKRRLTNKSSESESVFTCLRASQSKNLTSSGVFTRFPLTLIDRPYGALTKNGCASDLQAVN